MYYTAFGGSLATLNIERAFTVTVEADGQEIPVKMVYGTVADALEKAGITPGARRLYRPRAGQPGGDRQQN